jgi:integrase
MLYEVRNGGDPSATRQSSKKGVTVFDVCKRFEKEHISRKKQNTQNQYKRLIEKEINPQLGSKRVEEITTSEVSLLLHKVGKKHPVKANRLRAVMSKLFSLAERWGYRPQGTNPVTHIERYREQKRHRDLTADELISLAVALESMKDETGNTAAIAVIRLLLFTGARRGEILGLKWSEVDLERGMLHLGDSKTGQKTIYLNSAAREILDSVDKLVGCSYVFPANYRPQGRTVGPMPEWELREIWEQVRDKAGLGATKDVEAFRIHDLRHYADTRISTTTTH